MYRNQNNRRSAQWKFDKAAEMRKNPTPAEAKMYEILYQSVVPKYPENIFYRQSVQFGYILDFYCPKLRMGIEVDGSIHDGREAYDRNRDAALARRNIRLYHFSNDDVLYNPQEVAFQLSQFVQDQTNASKHACFIATAAYGTTTAKELDVLRKFRDTKLEPNIVGRRLTALYYSVSPPIAKIIARNKKMRKVIRECLNPTINFLKRKS